MNIQTQTEFQLPVGVDLLRLNLFGASSISAELMLSLVVSSISLISLVFWIKAFSRIKQKQELIPYQRSECVLGFIDVVAIFLVWMGSLIAKGVALLVINGFQPMESQSSDAISTNSNVDRFAEQGILLLYLSAAIGIAALLLAGAFLVIRYKTTNVFGLRFDNLSKQIGHGVTVFVMLFPLVMLIQWLLSMIVKYDHPILSALAENPTFVSISGCWAAAVLTAPLLEEFLFRGVFHHWLERLSVSKLSSDQLIIGGGNIVEPNSSEPREASTDSFVTAEPVTPNNAVDVTNVAGAPNPYEPPTRPAIHPVSVTAANQQRFAYWPIFISSLCFALVHLGQGLAPFPLFILAVGLGYLFRQTGSLIACITVHFLLNFYSMFVFTVMILLGETP